MDIADHWLTNARRVPSPNFNQRPPQQEPELIVIHCISLPPGVYGGNAIEQFFQNQLDPSGHPYFATIAEMQVSSHLLIKRDGELVQFVAFDQRAWHAGQSSFEGRDNCNDFSIGIELEGTDYGSFTLLQYQQLSAVITALQMSYPGLASGQIQGHSDIAPGRKTDPGPFFDWTLLRQMLQEKSNNLSS